MRRSGSGSDGAGGSPVLAGAGGDSTTASGAAPGSVGWQAPELLASLLRERAPHDPLLQAVDAAAAAAAVAMPASPGSTPEAEQGWERVGGGRGDAPALTPATPVPVDPRWRLTRAADVWSLGCVLFHVLDPGGHPFGETYEVRAGAHGVPRRHCLITHLVLTQRERNILHGVSDSLARLAPVPDAFDLVSAMLRSDPASRPTAEDVGGAPPWLRGFRRVKLARPPQVLEHPALWDDERRLAFLADLSDRLEREDAAGGSPLIAALEASA